jgi:FkbM family methyltransferase
MGQNSGSVYPISGVAADRPSGGGGSTVFDSADALAINEARMAHLDSLHLPLSGRTVLDAGCGVGHLAKYFVERNCRVTCVDGRHENIAILRSRYPALEAHAANLELDSLAAFGDFDIVFCYGLLYHLENPIAGLRNMAQVCRDLLLLETVVSDQSEPVLRLSDEPQETRNQALGPLGCRPSPAFVTMALVRVGFRYVYAPKSPPNHPDFRFEWRNDLQFSRDGHLLRCVFVASRQPLDNPELSLLLEDAASETRSFVPTAGTARSSGRVWLDVGAHLGEKTFPAAMADPTLRVYAFEPNLAVGAQKMGLLPNFVMLPLAIAEQDGSAQFHLNTFDAASSLLAMNPAGLQAWNGGDQLKDVAQYPVPTVRLDTFLDHAGIRTVDFLKIDAQGADLAVVRSAGERLKDIRKISLEVQTTPVPLYEGASDKDEVIRYLAEAGFQLTDVQTQSYGQEENLTFERRPGRVWVSETEALESREKEAVTPALPATHSEIKENVPVSRFSPARAYWNQRVPLANARDRILALSQAVNHTSDLWPYQWAQLMSVVMDYQPDVVLELGRGKGNSTCAFTEASNLNPGRTRILSLCLSDDWERETLPRVRSIVPKDWFAPLQTLHADILEFDYEMALSGAERVVIFWDAHGFDIAECVLGEILPVVANREHLVIMHDLSDARYNSEEQLEYGEYGLWKGNNWSGPRLKLGFIDSAVEESISALDFTTRNHLTLDSADHSFRTNLTPAQRADMQGLLGELFETQGHWFYFSLNESSGPYKFPRFERPKGA